MSKNNKMKNSWQREQERKRKRIKNQMKLVKPRPSWFTRFVVFIMGSAFGVIPSSIIPFKLVEQTSLAQKEYGIYIMLGLTMFLWIFLGISLNNWYNKKYKEFIELQQKL